MTRKTNPLRSLDRRIAARGNARAARKHHAHVAAAIADLKAIERHLEAMAETDDAEITWGHEGDAAFFTAEIAAIADRILKRGEFAEEGC